MLADGARLRIIGALIEEGELTVGDLVERLELAQPNVSNRRA